MAGTVSYLGRSAALLAGTWLALAAGRAGAQTIPGEREYKNNCAVCHGPTGKGDGEAVFVLRALKPGDLTQLSKNNNGTFPTQEVFQAANGRDDVAAHHLGESKTPTWGVNLKTGEGDLNPTSQANTRGRIQDLVGYIQTLQQK